MSRFIGLDVHRNSLEACFMDARGRVLERQTISVTRAAVGEFARTLMPTDRVVLESTSNSWPLVDLLEPHVAEVAVSNPLITRAIAQSKVKTDKIDASVLAHLLRCDYIPKVWTPDMDTRLIRFLTNRRAQLIADRTSFKNRIHSCLAQALVPALGGDLFSGPGRKWLSSVELPVHLRAAVDSSLRQLDQVESELERMAPEIQKKAHDTDQVRLLMTLPGVDYTVAMGLLGAIGDISRFRDANHLTAYLGLTPSTRQSGGPGSKTYHGPITRRGNSKARWLLVQAAQHVMKHPGPLGVFMRRLARRKNRNVAIVAGARKVVVVVYHMLTNDEPYRYAQPVPTKAKLARLRVAATGKRRVSGIPKGQPRSANYGTGVSQRTIPSLPDVYQREELPEARATEALPPGERKMLAEKELIDYAERLQEPTVIKESKAGESSEDSPATANSA